MSVPLPNEEGLTPAPSGSDWGRKVSRAYLAAAAIAAALMVRELVVGESGFGTMAISILTAPWSVLLASLARAVSPSLAPGVMRGLGLGLIVVAVGLNARILYGMAARAERDARAAKSTGGTTHG